MTREIIYKCNDCQLIIGNKVHITLELGNISGIAVPPHEAPNKVPKFWSVVNTRGNFQFCTPKCLASFFSKKIKSLNQKNML